MIRTDAPGKVVLWGEYAVLDGAPALTMAVEHRARVQIAASEQNWHLRARGFQAEDAICELGELLNGAALPPVADIVANVLRVRPEVDWPASAELSIDTRALHVQNTKLGLGSSAAATVAVQAACAALTGDLPDLEHALDAHRALQHGRGSGLDVATSALGGYVRFQAGTARRINVELPPHRFIWVGEAAATVDHLARFEQYRSGDDLSALSDLGASAEALFDEASLPRLADYAERLQNLDHAAGLGIYSPPHARVSELASAAHLVYKPCGAGGGDLGVVFAHSPDALSAFENQVERAGFTVMQLELAVHGVQVST